MGNICHHEPLPEIDCVSDEPTPNLLLTSKHLIVGSKLSTETRHTDLVLHNISITLIDADHSSNKETPYSPVQFFRKSQTPKSIMRQSSFTLRIPTKQTQFLDPYDDDNLLSPNNNPETDPVCITNLELYFRRETIISAKLYSSSQQNIK